MGCYKRQRYNFLKARYNSSDNVSMLQKAVINVKDTIF